MDVVVVASCLKFGLGASVLLGKVEEVRVFDANLFDDLTVMIQYSDL